ncbi:MAG: heterodisulfide reductase-related iron-sulfur binding cluster [Bacillota bacterium]|nr:heterodisulfide reductase-related iron-sulfur binding cluster [Bacillota bacterium]
MTSRYAVFWGCQIPARLPFFEKSTRVVLERLGIELVDLPGFTCCPEKTLIKNYREEVWVLTAARNLALAEQAGLPLLTPCNGCYSTLKTVLAKIKDSVALRELVTKRLEAIGLEFKGSGIVKHLIEMLHDDIGPAKIKMTVRRPMEGLRIAVHYGCHMLRPGSKLRFDDPLHPEKYDLLVRALGAESVVYDTKMLCCGSGLGFVGAQEEATTLLRKKLFDLQGKSDALTVVCPACFIQYDQRQYILQRQGEGFHIPVLTYPELLGLALEIPGAELGLQEHRISLAPFFAAWDSQRETLAAIKPLLDLAAVKRCYECGACVDDCPAAQASRAFHPRELIGSLLVGNLAELLREKTIWQCLECHTCYELCPQKFGMEHVFTTLKHLALAQGLAPPSLEGGVKGFLQAGKLGAVDEKGRRKLGLNALPPGGEAELQRLLGLPLQDH